MKLFGRTSGYYMFWTAFVYFWVGMYLAVTHSGLTHYATLGFILALSVPLLCPPVARYFNMEPVMFDLFRRKTAKEYLDEASNVYNLPKPTSVPPVPYVEPVGPSASKDSPTVYRIGKTEDGKVTLSLGNYSGVVVTMNNLGVDQLIRMLEAAKEPDVYDGNPTDDPDGGESIPVDTQKAA